MNSIFYEHKEYRAFPDHPGYWISSDGEVLSTRSPNRFKSKTATAEAPVVPHKIKFHPDVDGYLKFPLCGEKRGISFVHQAVLKTWGGPRPFVGAECRHLDGNRLNNNISNLRWGTHAENQIDRRNHKTTVGEKNHRHKMTESLVIKLRGDYIHKPLKIIAQENPQFSQFAIWAAVSGYTWKHLPGAIPKGRRCTKNGWRDGVQLRKENEENVQVQSVSAA